MNRRTRDAFHRQLQRRVEEYAGLVPSAEQASRLAAFASQRVRRLGLDEPRSYLELLSGRDPAADDELALLAREVSIGETYFFRDAPQCEAIRAVLATLGERRRRSLRIWSAACATGEEAYTLAMLAAEAKVAVRILGTDIDAEAIAAARAAAYGEWPLRRLPEPLRQRYLTAGGEPPFRVSESLRSVVTFQVHNLVKDPPPEGEGAWDLILCRNLFIYFAKNAVERAARRLIDALAPDGWLITAAAEHLDGPGVGARLETLPGTFGYRPLAADQGPEPPPRISLFSPPGASRGGGRIGGEARPAAEAPDGSGGSRATAMKRIRQGRSLLESGRPQEALTVLGRLAAEHPLAPEIHYWSALAHRRLGHTDDYQAALRRALFLAPDFWPAAFLLGGFHEERGEHDRALAAYRQAFAACGSEKGLDSDKHSLQLSGLDDVGSFGRDVAAVCYRKIERLRGGSRCGTAST